MSDNNNNGTSTANPPPSQDTKYAFIYYLLLAGFGFCFCITWMFLIYFLIKDCIHHKREDEEGRSRRRNTDSSISDSNAELSNSSSIALMNPGRLLAGKYKPEQVYPDKSYYDVKKVFLRLKSRKFFQKGCMICCEDFKDSS